MRPGRLDGPPAHAHTGGAFAPPEDRLRPTRRQLAWTLFAVGATAYGGPAIVAQIRRAVVTRRRWLDDVEFAETLAFCQTLPGPVAVQTAAHVGWRLYRGPGVAIALTAYVLPAFLLMTGLSAAYFRWGDLAAVKTIFLGLGAVIVAVVADSVLALTRPAVRDLRGLSITAAAAAAFFAGADTLLVLAGAAAAGEVLFLRDPAPAAAPAAPDSAPAPRSSRTLITAGGLAAAATAALLLTGELSPVLQALGATMAKIDLLAFGGGYTAVALMYREVVTSPAHAWLTPQEFIDGLALGQITPGPVIITATFIGYRAAGLTGAVVASIFVFLPSALLLTVLAPHFARFRDAAVVRSAVRGLLAAFVAMLLFVLARVAVSAFADLRALPIAVAAFVALRKDVPTLAVVLAGAGVALLLLG